MSNNTNKIFNFEKRKLLINKPLAISFISILVLSILVIIIAYFVHETSIANEVTSLQKEQILSSYSEEILELNQSLKSPLIEDAEKEIYIDRINKLEFLLSNNIIENEFIEYESNSFFKNSNYLCTSFMFYVFTAMYIPLIIFSLLISIYIFNDVSNGMIKNIVASGISKKSVYRGKLLFQLFLNLIIVSMVFVVTFLIGAFEIDTSLILKVNGNYFLINACVFYIIQVIGELIILCVCSIFFDSLIIILKNILYSISFIITLICFNFVCGLFIQKYIDINSFNGIYSVDQFLPIINIKYYLEYIQSLSLLIGIIYIAISILIIKINEFLFQKSFT